MSRENIISMLPEHGSLTVTFRMRRGGLVSYKYVGEAAAAILAGDDPAGYAGERGGEPGSMDVGGIADAVSDVSEIAELGEIL